MSKREACILTAEMLEQIVERVVAVAHPQRIMLFGSATRSDASE